MTEQETRAVLRLWGLERLEDATRETWPWWAPFYQDDGGSSSLPDYLRGRPTTWHRAYMPDFPTDDAAAIALFRRLNEVAQENDEEGYVLYYEDGCWCIYPVREPLGESPFPGRSPGRSALAAAAALVAEDK